MKRNYQKGFTIVELMISMLLVAIVAGSIASLYISYQRQHTLQEEVTEMQQEVRVALEIMMREIRHAGHDTTSADTAGAGFIQASPFQIQFSMDLTDDAGTGDPDGDILDANENVIYSFSGADDIDTNGIVDVAVGGAADLMRTSGAGAPQPIATNIHAIGFAYAYDANSDGVLELNAISNEVIWAVPDGGGNWVDLDNNSDGVIDVLDGNVAGGAADATQLQQIRAVKVWILARTNRTDTSYVDNVNYKVGANVVNPNIIAPPDNFRRRLMTVDVRCRNMGLQ